MNKKRKPLKKFKEETRRYCVIHVHSESEAEQIFKKYYSYQNFGWVDEIRKNHDDN